jgi:hypothetical protein
MARIAANVAAIPLGPPSPATSMRPTRTAARKHARMHPEGPSRPSLFGLAPGGACHAAPVAGSAVRSYRTLSPLPRTDAGWFAFCGAIPGVTPAGRYPAPCLRGARTFLHLEAEATRQRPPGQLAGLCDARPPARQQRKRRATGPASLSWKGGNGETARKAIEPNARLSDVRNVTPLQIVPPGARL